MTMQKTTRVSIDFPYQWHTLLKMFCAKKGISIRQYIIDIVLQSMQEESDEVDDESFKEIVDRLMRDKDVLWKKLND